MVNITTPPGSSVAHTNEIMKQVEACLDSIPEVEFYSETVGYGLIGGAGPSSGMLIVKLHDWSERKNEGSDAQSVVDRINAMGAKIADANVFAFLPPLIDGYGVSGGFEINLQDQAGGRADSLYSVGQRFMAALQQRPEISSAYSTFNVAYPQYTVEVDPVKCERAGITARRRARDPCRVLQRRVCIQFQPLLQAIPSHDTGFAGIQGGCGLA